MKKKTTSATRHAVLNFFIFPGLGSLLAKRWLAGIGQTSLVTAGSVMLFVWLFKTLGEYYSLMSGDTQSQSSIAWIGITGGALFITAWLWSGVTGISLLQEASETNLQAMKNSTTPMQKLEPTRIAAALAAVPQWQRQGDTIFRTFQFKDFPAAIKFVDTVAELAEQAWHHPDIDIRWNKVTLVLTTHDAGGLTEKDFDLARQFDRLSLH